MPKLKTHKSWSKRVRITKKGKVMKRTAGQNHFNAREAGKVTRNKRRPGQLSSVLTRNIKRLLPYN